MILHESKFAAIVYDDANGIIKQKFSEQTAEMSTADFKAEMREFARHVIDKKAGLHLIDSVDLEFTIAPDVQEWMNTEIFEQFKSFVKRVAFLVPRSVFAQVSVEQTMNEKVGQQFGTLYFENEDNALNWLKNRGN